MKMRIALKYLASIFLLSFSIKLLAQDFELIKIGAAYYPKQSIKNSSIDAEVGFFEWSGQVMIPQVLKSKKTILTHKVSYANLSVGAEANLTTGPIEFTKRYHSISYNLGLIQSLGPKWKLMLNFNPTLASDFATSLSEDDLLFQGKALLINTKKEKIKYGFGLAFTTRFGRKIAIPIGMFVYDNSKMNLNILLPSKASIMFKSKGKTFLYGLEAGLDGGIFNNTNEIQTIDILVDEAGYSQLAIGPTLALSLKKSVIIQLKGGVAVGRRLDFIYANEEVFDRTPEVGPFFSLGFVFSPKKKSVEAPSS